MILHRSNIYSKLHDILTHIDAGVKGRYISFLTPDEIKIFQQHFIYSFLREYLESAYI